MKQWMTLLVLFSLASLAFAEESLTIESSVDNRNFLINGIQFAAKTMCPNFEIGDEIVFVDGNPDGSSADATIVDMRSNEACAVWSQSPL
ncbi:MAG: hypothetical protein P4M14_02325 [Gammaproteobacteria bacterium]|nr:hypothetical protein [Gammaproteobacteria bacterium]